MKSKTPVPLGLCVSRSLQRYFDDLDGEQPAELYDMVLGEVEKPLLEMVMQQANGNQSCASRILGINRNTLRKKLKLYGID